MSPPPRLVPGRALPEVAYLPGRGDDRPRVEIAPSCGLPAASLREHEAFRWGIDLFNGGFAWEAHDAWELVWAATDPAAPERALLGGLVQAAAAVVQARLGRWRGVATLTRRARGNLEAAGGDQLAGIDLRGLAAALAAWAEQAIAAEHPGHPPRIWLAEW